MWQQEDLCTRVMVVEVEVSEMVVEEEIRTRNPVLLAVQAMVKAEAEGMVKTDRRFVVTTEVTLLEKMCSSLTKVVTDKFFRADRQSQDFVDLMQTLSDAKLFVEKAHSIEDAPKAVKPKKTTTSRKVKNATI